MRRLLAAALDIAETTVDRVVKLGDSPGGSYPYAVVSVTYDRPYAYTLDRSHGYEQCRLTTQSFGRSQDSVLETDEALRRVFLDQRLDADGWDCGPIEHQVTGPVIRDPDNAQILGVTTTYLFAAQMLTEEQGAS